MDNFSAHKAGLEQLRDSLQNTKVMWLPPNATSIHQPLDQGIIQNWKTHIQYQFVMFMAQTFDSGKDLSREMHVLRAIRWGISAWENDVTPSVKSEGSEECNHEYQDNQESKRRLYFYNKTKR
jgi:hypothetical protein